MEIDIKKKRKEFRTFRDLNYYDLNQTDSYALMPFKFHRINSEIEVIVNEVGDL